MPEEPTKRCFVIGPIGEPGTDVRRKADWLLNGIIRPVLTAAPFSYLVRRADDFPEPGMITGQVINAILEWDLVIADLTGPNANAFYELALRHMAEKPVIHFIDAPHKPPFDVSDYRTIPYSIEEHAAVEAAKVHLKSQVEAVEAPGYELSNPVTKARGYQKLAQSSDSTEQMLASVVEKVEALEAQIALLSDTPRTRTYSGAAGLKALFGEGWAEANAPIKPPPHPPPLPPGGIASPVNVVVRHPPPPKK